MSHTSAGCRVVNTKKEYRRAGHQQNQSCGRRISGQLAEETLASERFGVVSQWPQGQLQLLAQRSIPPEYLIRRVVTRKYVWITPVDTQLSVKTLAAQTRQRRIHGREQALELQVHPGPVVD
jgi:hypothetical protein